MGQTKFHNCECGKSTLYHITENPDSLTADQKSTLDRKEIPIIKQGEKIKCSCGREKTAE